MPPARLIHFPFDPLPVHLPFHASNARIKCAIGGVGSGKTAALCMEAIRFALAQPGSDMILTRRTVPDLRRSTEKELFEVMPDELEKACKIVRLGGHVDSIRFPSGSLLTLVGMEDYRKHKSMNLAWIGIDEASEQTFDNFSGLVLQRLRQPSPLKGAVKLPPGQKMIHQAVLASNPAGQDWLWETFVNESTRWKNTSVHISTPMDNPYLPPEYIDMLLQMPLAYIRRFVECRFDAAAGRVYPEWDSTTHVVPARKPGFYGERILMAMDPGVLAPTATLWAEIDKARGRIVIVAEYEEPGRGAPEHASAWRRQEQKLKPARIVRRVADPNIAKRDQGTTMELADIYGRLGFNFERGPVRQDIRIPALANLIATRQIVATEACPRVATQISEARWEDQLARLRDLGEFREQIKKGNDHLHDCAQYLATIYVAPSMATVEAPPPPNTQDEIEEAWHRERRAKLKLQNSGQSKTIWTPAAGVIV